MSKFWGLFFMPFILKYDSSSWH
ncbi:MAG: hypothetical protein QME61_03865 [Patescibacteria group bacterium]|nr:hypothetical protein [Patescibacteria group bacterium]